MAGLTANILLDAGDPAPVKTYNAKGRSPFLLLGDHAGSAIPASLGDLGLSKADRTRHIAVDIGTAGLGHALADLLDAPFIHQTYSRLVIDCNRDPTRPDAIPSLSDGSRVPGNAHLDEDARMARTTAVHAPYHDAIASHIGRRQGDGQETALLSLHSFTPVLDDIARPWAVGVLHWRGRTDFARAMLSILERDATICVGDNQPYQMDETDYTVPRHAFPNRLRYAEIEIRQDLIGESEGQQSWADRIGKAAITGLASVLPDI